ncbi:HEAT repeat domain-containing protein [Desulfovibrio aerotolerans]|uniref:HEAT repeat domain-containing protein n=1 Tax=Solidesulfovibrio aerotolerans TaxID=295255 RepID=A0A7C9NHL2_9BACT|nr:HEAT repeat domain-containing protein [Solidesulfovibrio aerotolerans]MYL81836.1 HEAT repeat domain-containing protein [Solidesulfovibrio aerotolerans]
MVDSNDLCQRLGSNDPDVLRDAAYDAGESGALEVVPLLANLLCTHNLGVQEAADRALRKIGGKEVVAAVKPLLRSDDAPARNAAMDILRAVGAQDFPTLLELLHDADPDIRIFASDILGSTESRLAVSPLCEALLKDPEVNVRYQAAVSLGELAFAEAAPGLGKALGDEEWVQFAVIEALAKIRDAASVGALVKALDKSTDLVASMIVDALGEIGNIKAVTMLLKRMDAAPGVLRNKIAKAVVRILGGKALSLLSPVERDRFRGYLLAALGDDEDDVQDAAVSGLGSVGGDDAAEAVLAHAARLDREHHPERYDHAVVALREMGLTEALGRALREGVAARRGVALDVLAGLPCAECPRLLIDAFPALPEAFQPAAAKALAGIAGADAVDFFLELLDSTNEAVLLEAVAYLGGGMQVDAAGERLFALLGHPSDTVKEAALDACVAIGGAVLDGRFRELAQSDDPMDRLMAVYALGRMGVGDHMDIIRAALADEIPDIRKIALETLADSCGHDEASLKLIVSRLSDDNRDVRLAVVEVLGGCDSDKVLPYLEQALLDSDDWVRIRAVEALGNRGERESVPRLRELAGDASKLVALKAVETLGEIGGPDAFQALLGLIASDDPELAGTAETAIARLQDEQGER